jgi:hypothetical protein
MHRFFSLLFILIIFTSSQTIPEFPQQFKVNFKGRDQLGEYTGIWYWDYPNGRDRNDYFRNVGGQVQHQIHIARYDQQPLWAYYRCEWLDICTKKILVPPMR